MTSEPSTPIVRVATWSGPRNISTAMMRSFGNRPDTFVVDEPFYACYLARTGLDHPGREQILQQQPADWATVIGILTGPLPTGKSVWYQKHMAHHLLGECPWDWMFQPEFEHVFLIRQPRQMLLSLWKVLGEVTLEQTGLPQQVQIFRAVRQQRGATPAVIDADDVLVDPATTLRRLCDRLGIDFTSEMLQWPAGPRPTDGVWARHWYERVNPSTGFVPQPSAEGPLPAACESLLAQCEELYSQLATARLVQPEP